MGRNSNRELLKIYSVRRVLFGDVIDEMGSLPEDPVNTMTLLLADKGFTICNYLS